MEYKIVLRVFDKHWTGCVRCFLFSACVFLSILFRIALS